MIRLYEPYIAKNQKKYVNDCLDSNMLTFRGKYNKLFEDKLRETLNTEHVILTSNGSVSLYALFHCLGLKGKKVITQSLNYIATTSQLKLVGADVIFCDFNKEDLQIDLNHLEKLCRENPFSSVVVSGLYGYCKPMHDIGDICERYGCQILEDAAECFCSYDIDYNQAIGTFGYAGSFSFFANKIITCGEGGCIVTDEDWLAERIRKFVDQSAEGDFWHSGVGTNFRMTNIQAAIGLAQLEDLDLILNKKRWVSLWYKEKLSQTGLELVSSDATKTNHWMPVYKLPKGTYYNDIKEIAGSFEIRPIFYRSENILNQTKCKEFEYFRDKFVILPCGPNLTEQEISFICDEIKKVI